ncbi:MAG: DUF2911 domain-containing protein [Chitinophagaceae bacterium]|nr:MAG: DUF2911 domain-containing protein [Chitinophagaceae bacterium]
MKKMAIACSALLLSYSIQAQVKMPAPSPLQTITQDFALGTIEVKYSRPITKGRKVFGDLVPMNKLWRTGANSATVVRFTDVVEINGKKIDTGSYALYTVPGTENWEIILNKGYKNSGVVGYKESDDVVRFKVDKQKLRKKVESFTMQFANVLPESCDLELMWEKTAVSIPIKGMVKNRLRTQLEAALLTDKKPWFQAAQYYYDYEKNVGKAADYAGKAVAENPKAFWMWLFKARMEKEAGNTTAARESANTSLQLAREAKNDDYIKMNEDLLKTLK